MAVLFRPVQAVCAALLISTPAFAEGEAQAVANDWSLFVHTHLIRMGVWTTGIHRLNDLEFLGLLFAILVMAFATSGVGMILFKAKGLNFRAGWMLALPLCVAAMFGYCYARPYPTLEDWPSMYLFSGLVAVCGLSIARLLKSSAEAHMDGGEPPPRVIDPALEARMKMAVRSRKAGNIA
jgi:hypothetical protein